MKRIVGMMIVMSGIFLPFMANGYKPSATGALYVVIDKSDNSIALFDAVDWLIRWPCTFGSNDLRDKMIQGDRRTPEGRFKLVSKYPHKKWNKFMGINYPTITDYQKFEERKKAGLIPTNAKIGGDIGIHGTWPHEDWAVENLQPWTLGCISMKNEDLNELYSLIKVGTPIIIQQ